MTLALPVFDPAKHHIGLGEEGGTSYGLLLDGPYRKAFQRDQEVPVAFGGSPPTPLGPVSPHPPASSPPTPGPVEPIPPPSPPAPVPPITPAAGLSYPPPQATDLITDLPGTALWTQDDFSGGAFQYNWRADKAMYLASENMSPRPFDNSLRTIPPLVQIGTRNLGGEAPILVFRQANQLCAVFGSSSNAGIFRLNLGGGGGTAWHPIPATPGAAGISAAAYDPSEDVLWLGIPGNGSVGSNGLLWRMDCSNLIGVASGSTPPWKTVTDYTGPAIATGYQPVGIAAANGSLVVAWAKVTSGVPVSGITVYLGALPPNTEDVAGVITWTRVGNLRGKWRDWASYNGFVYVLTGTDQGGTQLMSVDPAAASMFPIAEFPYNFRGECLRVFGGRLYVGGSATDVGGTSRFAELHEVTGSSLRLVRSFGDEYRNPAAPPVPATLSAMEPYEGLLWFGAAAGGLVSYDVTTDAFHGGSLMQIGSGTVTAMISASEQLYCWISYGGANDGWYRIGQASDTFGSTWYGVVKTSDFAPYLDVLKDWQEVRVFTRYGGVSVEISQDGGVTTTGVSGTQVQDGNNYLTTCNLTSIPDGYRIRLRFNLSRGTSGAGFTELVSFTLAYKLPLPPAPVNTVAPTISGSAVKRQQLYVDIGQWSNAPTRISVQWRRCDASGGSCGNIGGNTINYELGKADVGSTIRCVVTATNAGGSTQVTTTQTAVVTESDVVAPPQPEFTASAVYGRAPLTVAFTDLTQYDRATSWNWGFGDGGVSSAQHPIHVYNTPGQYNVALQAINSAGSITKLKVDYITVVSYAPQAEFTASAVYGRAPFTVAFTDLSDYDRPTSWLWNFGDGNTSTNQHPFHTYAAAGTYTVTLTATNATGSSVKTKTGYITVEGKLPDKHAWTFTVCGADRVEALDRSTEHYNLELLRNELWRFADGGLDLTLTDADGETWPVKLISLYEEQPVILPVVEVDDPASASSTSDREGYFRLTLVERV